MSTVLDFLEFVLPSMQTQRERDDAYLAEAVDIYDLERRMREIDERRRELGSSGPAFGLYLR